MRHDDNCIFCKIVRGEAPAIKVHDDELTLSFMDIRPASEGHTLIISKEHFENLLDIDASPLTAVTLNVQRLARVIQGVLEPDGIRVNQFNGAAAGQTVFHYHTHIVPIWEGRYTGAHGRGPGDSQMIEGIARKIRTGLQG